VGAQEHSNRAAIDGVDSIVETEVALQLSLTLDYADHISTVCNGTAGSLSSS
jgi:hypothetical protein